MVIRYKNPFIHGSLIIKSEILSKLGSYDENFLVLPESVLVTSMAVHQRYFPVYSSQKESGGNKLLPQFIAIRNGNEQHLETVCQGNERVLRARLSDARFFYEEDLKKPLQHFQELANRLLAVMYPEPSFGPQQLRRQSSM